MNFLCLNCGEVNINNQTKKCSYCEERINETFYSELLKYSHNAVIYGFDYRLLYEEQIKQTGEINVKYSLLEPSNYYSWLAAAALSGMVGNLAYDLVKIVGKKIIDYLSTKPSLTADEEKLKAMVNDNNRLILFTNYIQSFYKGNEKINKKVEEVLIEEQIIHTMLDNNFNEFKEVIDKFESKKERPYGDLARIYHNAAKLAGENRKKKPKQELLDNNFKSLKKIIKEKKEKKK